MSQLETSADQAAMIAVALRALPDLVGQPVRVLSHSWDSVALDFGDRLICKFPRNPVALASLQREA
ncbi:MAG: hypothetical protein ABI832_23440, partial [bacterium]